MPQLRSGKVLRASEVKLVDPELSSPNSSGTGCEPGEKLLVKRSPRLALKRKPGQPLPSFPQPARLSGASFKCFAFPVPVQKEQDENRQKFPGKKNKGIQRRKSPSRSKDVASAVSNTAGCEDWQAASTAAAMCWQETLRGTGQSQQLLFSGTTLHSKFSAGIERNEYYSKDLNFSGFHMGSRNSEKEGKHSCMEIKFEVPSLKGEVESTERHGISCFPEPGGLQSRKVTWNTEVKCTDSIMTQNMQIPDFRKKILGTQETVPEPKPHQKDDILERLNGRELVGSRALETQKRKWRCLGKKGRRSVVKPKVHGPKERGGSALLEQHTQCPESSKGALNMRNRNALLSQQLQDLSGQEQPTTRRKKRCVRVEQQSSSSQEGPDSPGESAEEQLKAIEQDSGTSQAVKKVKTKQNRAEDSKKKESRSCRSLAVSTAGDTESKSFLCHAVTKEPAVQCRKRQQRSGQIKHLQSLSVTAAKKVMNTSAKCDAEHCSNALNHCSGLLCATNKNPFVMLEDCSYINTLVKASASGTTNSYKLNGFFRVAHGTGELNDRICSPGRRQNKRSLIKGGLSPNKEKNENEEGCVSCCLSESSKCLRGKKWNIGRKPRKKMKITEKSADMASKCKKYELQTEAAVAMSNSFAVSGLNHILSASYDHTSDFDAEKNTHEVQTLSAWKKNNTKLLALETGFKKTSELSVLKGQNSSHVAHYAAASDSLRVLAQIHDVSDRHKSKTGENLNKVNKKLQQFTCQRTIPMTGKKVWPVESCARTSEWFLKNHRSISEGGRLLKAAFEDSSDKSSVKAVGHSAVTENVRQLDLHTSLAEITKEITHKKIDPNIDCQASLETMESSSVGINETLSMNSENGESPVNTDRSAMTFNHGDGQEVKATLNFTAKQKEGNEDVTERNLPVTLQNGTTKQKDKNEGDVTNRNLPVTVQKGTTKQKDKNEGDVTNRNLPVTVQNGTTKQKDKNEGDVTNRNLPATVQKGTTKQKDKNEGDVTNRNLPVTVQNGTSASNTNSINLSCKVSEVNQTFSDLNLIKPLTSGSLTKFKIPLCRNKPESKKQESAHSFESKTCTPLELLESTSPGRQKTDEETFLIKCEQHPLPVMSVPTSPTSIQKKTDEIDSKDFQHSGSVNLSDEISVLPESFSAYPHPLLDGQPEPSVPDFYGTECVLKSSFPDHSWNAVDHFVGLEINGDRKSRGNFLQHKSQNLPDILEAYNQDVLVIDVIQDDPDLFGASNEEELAPAHCENSPVKASSANCIKDTKVYIKPESPVTSEKTYSVESSFRCMQESGMSSDTENSCNLMLKAEDVKTHNSSRASSLSRDVSEDFLKDRQQSKLDELLTSLDVDEKFKLADGVPDVEEENKSEAEKSDSKCKMNCELLSRLPLNDQKVNLFSGSTEMKSWTNGYKSSGQSTLLPVKNCGDFEPWKMEKNAIACHSVQQILDALNLPHKYCRYYFMTSRGCERTKCWFCHVPGQGDEKILQDLFLTYHPADMRAILSLMSICMAVLRTYISINEPRFLKRAVQVFVQYYREVTPGVDFSSEVLNDILVSLLSNCMLQEVFQILNVIVQIKTLPAVDVLLKVFDHVASLNVRSAVPTLISTFCKLIDAGIFLELEHFDYIIKLLHQLQVSSWEMSTVLNIKSRFKERYFAKTWIFDFNLAVAEIQHCKEKRDWTKLGALYLNARTGCEHFDDLQKLFLSIAEILTKASETDKPGVPFCDFADAVVKNSQHNKTDRLYIGRTGISVMYSYHKVLQWKKGSKVLDKLHELQIHFTLSKGLIGPGRSASRCQIVNKATEIFLHSGNLDGAIRVLRESEWITDAPLWPCDKMDILNRHNLLCAIVHKYLKKSLYRQAFEVLQNLPGLQKHSDIVDASQYSRLFNKLINACFENKNLGVSSSAVDFMLSRKIAIDFVLLRGLITALGRSSLWSKARTYYKNALSLGCYPELQGNLYHKLLKIPSYLSEVEMLLTIEIFLVSNASDIQSPRTSQTLQIILKRSEDAVQNNNAYHGAVERLIQAAHLSDPKLFLKHMTMNVNMEEVYSLEHSSALKWLQENMEWAEKVWLFQ